MASWLILTIVHYIADYKVILRKYVAYSLDKFYGFLSTFGSIDTLVG